jgi:hypothetical protein
MPDWKEYVDAAQKELTENSYAEVQRDTSFKWAARAIVKYNDFERSGNIEDFLTGDEYRHEAIEHSAEVRDQGATMAEIEAEINRHRKI